MAVKKLKRVEEEKPVNAVAWEAEVTEAPTNDLGEASEESLSVASVEVMDKALILVSKKFNLNGEYVMTSFNDGGKSCSITMNNGEFQVTVKIRDTELHGLR